MSKWRISLLVLPCLLVGLLFTLLALIGAGAAAASAPCAVPGAYATVQAAVNDPACDLINVAAGTFAETVTVGPGRNVTVQGQGPLMTTVDGAGAGSVFTVQASAVVTLSAFTLANGGGINNDGAGIYNDGGTLTLINMVLSQNSAGLGSGGGIYVAAGMVTLENSVLDSNGAAFNAGGGIYNAGGVVAVNNSTLSGNSAERGGGIFNAGVMTLTHSVLSENSACCDTGSGGGIRNEGTLTVGDTTLDTNSAGIGGGIYNMGALALQTTTLSGNNAYGSAGGSGGGIYNAGTATVRAATVAGNGSTLGFGGGIYNQSTGTLAVEQSTVAGNSGRFVGGVSNNGGQLNFTGSILADNTATESGSGSDCAGTLTSQDYNLVEVLTSCTVTGTTTHNITGQDPRLATLQDNGGPTWTQALLPGSPALDAGNCPMAATDQRGYPRPVDLPSVPDVADGCDIGAYELQNISTQFLPQIFRAP